MNPFDDRPLFIPGQSDDNLAKQSPPPITLGTHELDRIARLALMLTQEEARRNTAAQRIAPATHFVPYEERSPESRAAMRAGVVRLLQALVMLGWIEL